MKLSDKIKHLFDNYCFSYDNTDTIKVLFVELAEKVEQLEQKQDHPEPKGIRCNYCEEVSNHFADELQVAWSKGFNYAIEVLRDAMQGSGEHLFPCGHPRNGDVCVFCRDLK